MRFLPTSSEGTSSGCRTRTRVPIDIRPGTKEPTPVKLGTRGVLQAAFLSTADFDAITVNPMTVQLAASPVRLQSDGTPMATIRGVNSDGRNDLVVFVGVETLEMTPTVETAILSGQTYGGELVAGDDEVHVMP